MLATIEVMGATVVTTCSSLPSSGPFASAPAVTAGAGHEKAATLASAAALSSFDAALSLPHPADTSTATHESAIMVRPDR